jgi:diketogulonate reductase-like aldo/keto reductase
VIPKTTNPERLAENINVFDFTLDETEMRIIGLLDAGERTGPNPDEFG